MKQNRFHRDIDAILAVSKELNLPLATAASAYANRQGWTDHHAELNAFRAEILEYTRAKADNEEMDHDGNGHTNLADFVHKLKEG